MPIFPSCNNQGHGWKKEEHSDPPGYFCISECSEIFLDSGPIKKEEICECTDLPPGTTDNNNDKDIPQPPNNHNNATIKLLPGCWIDNKNKSIKNNW